MVSRVGTLIRMTDYLDSQILHCKEKKLYDIEEGSQIPAPRDSIFIPIVLSLVRLLFDQIQPTLATDYGTDYSGLLLLQNPSYFVQLTQSPSIDKELIQSSIASSIVFRISFGMSFVDLSPLSYSPVISNYFYMRVGMYKIF